MNTRATSTTLGYVLTLGIVTLLITGLLTAAGGTVQDQREQVVRTELLVVGEQIVADIEAADRLYVTGGSDFVVSRDLPNEVVGSSYTVSVVTPPTGNPYLRLRSTSPEITVELAIAVSTDLEERSFGGGGVVVTYDSGTGALEVDNRA